MLLNHVASIRKEIGENEALNADEVHNPAIPMVYLDAKGGARLTLEHPSGSSALDPELHDGVSSENGQVLFSGEVCFCPLQVQGHSFAIDENNAAIDQLLAGAVILLIAGQRGERHHKLH